MRKLILLLALLAPTPLFAQGAFIPPQTALKNINGIVMPIANATVTVCAASAGGVPCSPVLVNTIFKDAALTQPLTNPFSADANGNYQFAAAVGIYTVTVTAAGYAGYSYQITVASGSGGGGGGVPNGAITFTSATQVTFPTSFTSKNLLWTCWDDNFPNVNAIYPNGVTLNTSTFAMTFTFSTPQSGFCVGNGSGGGGGGGGIPNPFIVNSSIPGSTPALPPPNTTSIAINSDANFAVAANGSAYYDDVPTNATLGYTQDFIWSASPTSPSSLTGGSSAAVTLPNCPRGLDPSILDINSDTVTSDYFVDIAGTGTAEYVPVTATTCTFGSNGASGTITIVPANSHAAGYAVGTASQGAQEAINWIGVNQNAGRLAYIRMPCGIVNWDAPVIMPLNASELDGGNCARVWQTHTQSGLILGDHTQNGNFFEITVSGLGFAANYSGTTPQLNMVSTATWVSGVNCTTTVTFTANHDFHIGDWIYVGGSLNQNQMQGVHQVATVPSATQITWTGGVNCNNALVGTIYAGGYAIHNYAGIENDLSVQGTLRDIRFYNYQSSANNAYNYLIENFVDENMLIDNFTNSNTNTSIRPCFTTGSGVTQSNPEWCGAAILEPFGEGIITLDKASIYCFPGNCIDNWGGNDTHILNSVLENWNQFPVRVTRRRGGFGVLDITNTHIEASNCRFSTTMGCNGAVMSSGQQVNVHGGAFPGVYNFPEYGTNGSANLHWYYYIIPISSTSDTLCTSQPNDQRCIAGTNLGTGPVLPVGYALADSSSGGTFAVAWPAIRGATSYNLLRSTQPSSPATLPIVNPYGTGNFLIASAINPLTACTDVQCSFTDSVGLTPTSYAVPTYGASSYCPFVDYWPAQIFLGCGSDVSGASIYAIPYYGPYAAVVTENTPGTDVINFLTNSASPDNADDVSEATAQAFPFRAMAGQSLPDTSTVPGISTMFPAKTGFANDTQTNIKGILNFEYQPNLTLKDYPFDVMTLEDCNFIKTRNTYGMHPSNDACDVAIGLDQKGGLSLRGNTSISLYVGTVGDNSSYLLRLTTAGLAIPAESANAGHATCFKTGGVIGYCSTVVSSSGTCTCN